MAKNQEEAKFLGEARDFYPGPDRWKWLVLRGLILILERLAK